MTIVTRDAIFISIYIWTLQQTFKVKGFGLKPWYTFSELDKMSKTTILYETQQNK